MTRLSRPAGDDWSAACDRGVLRTDEARPKRWRRAALAGVSYPLGAQDLASLVDALLDGVAAVPLPGRPVALLAPHAALIPLPYCGAVAAAAYHQLKGFPIERVVVLAPSHHHHDGAVLVPDVDGFTTPLGAVPLDGAFLADVAGRLGPLAQPVTEEEEHAVEVQLPFLQRCLGRFRLAPLLLEDQSIRCVARLAAALLGGLVAVGGAEHTLLVASSDLSHDHDAGVAGRLDRSFLDLVAKLDAEGLMAAVASGDAEGCGAGAVAATLIAARGLGAQKACVLRHATSGDITGNNAQVVGYGAAVAYYEQAR